MQETVLFLKLEMATVVLLIKSMVSDQKVQDLRFVQWGFEDACVGNGHDISSRLLTPIHLQGWAEDTSSLNTLRVCDINFYST